MTHSLPPDCWTQVDSCHQEVSCAQPVVLENRSQDSAGWKVDLNQEPHFSK